MEFMNLYDPQECIMYVIIFVYNYKHLIASPLRGKTFLPHCHMQLLFSQKQLPHKMKTRLVIIKCAGGIFWQLFLWEVY